MNIDLNIELKMEGLSRTPFSLSAIDIEGIINGAEIEDDCKDDAPAVVSFDIANVRFFDYEREQEFNIDPRLYDYVKALINVSYEDVLHEKIIAAYYKHLREMEE